MQIQPSSQFTIFRQIGDHTDTSRDSYYLSAEIRNTQTAELITTVYLENRSNGEYAKKWNVITNNAPDGTWITIKTIVYTDSDHTTKSTKYSEMADTYLIKEYVQHYAGGIDIDYDRIAKMISQNKPAEVKIPETDLTPLIEAIEGLRNDIKAIPQPDKIDYDLISKKLDNFYKDLELKFNIYSQQILSKEPPEIINYKEVESGIANIKEAISSIESNTKITKEITEKNNEAKKEIVNNIAGEVNKLINL